TVLRTAEPLGALDKNLREQMQVEITRIQRAVGITAVYVTHDQTEAMTMSDRVVVFNAGRIEQAAPPLEVYGRPATRFVAEFVGDSNILEGTVDGTTGQLRLISLSLTLSLAPGVRREGPLHVPLRPERIRPLGPESAPADLSVVPLKVGMVTHFGESTLPTGPAGAQPLRVRVSGEGARDVRAGDEVS